MRHAAPVATAAVVAPDAAATGAVVVAAFVRTSWVAVPTPVPVPEHSMRAMCVCVTMFHVIEPAAPAAEHSPVVAVPNAVLVPA